MVVDVVEVVVVVDVAAAATTRRVMVLNRAIDVAAAMRRVMVLNRVLHLLSVVVMAAAAAELRLLTTDTVAV